VKSLGVDRDIVNKMTIVTQHRTEIHPKVLEKERNGGFALSRTDRFRYAKLRLIFKLKQENEADLLF
jgi:hypothetical protein